MNSREENSYVHLSRVQRVIVSLTFRWKHSNLGNFERFADVLIERISYKKMNKAPDTSSLDCLSSVQRWGSTLSFFSLF